MAFKERILSGSIARAFNTFPALVLTGPRQSGKTTLCRRLFGRTHRFAGLEDPDVRLRARADPRAFLDQYPPPVIIDEIQYCPELLSYIKTRIDEDRRPGPVFVFAGTSRPPDRAERPVLRESLRDDGRV